MNRIVAFFCLFFVLFFFIHSCSITRTVGKFHGVKTRKVLQTPHVKPPWISFELWSIWNRCRSITSNTYREVFYHSVFVLPTVKLRRFCNHSSFIFISYRLPLHTLWIHCFHVCIDFSKKFLWQECSSTSDSGYEKTH